MSNNPLAVNNKTQEAQDIVQTSVYYAMGAGIVPIPLFEFYSGYRRSAGYAKTLE